MRGPEADGAIDRDAAEKIEEEPGVDLEGLMLKRRGEARKKHEEIDRVARENRDGVFDPPTGSHARKERRVHGPILAAPAP
jgi:hypothetical protein